MAKHGTKAARCGSMTIHYQNGSYTALNRMQKVPAGTSPQATSTLDIKRRPRGCKKASDSQEAKVQVYMYQGGTKGMVARTQQSMPKKAATRRAGARRKVSEEVAWQEGSATKPGANGRGTLM